MFLREDEHLIVEKAPVAGVLADGDDGNQEARGSGEIRGLSYRTVVVSLRWIVNGAMTGQRTCRACFSSTNNLSMAP